MLTRFKPVAGIKVKQPSGTHQMQARNLVLKLVVLCEVVGKIRKARDIHLNMYSYLVLVLVIEYDSVLLLPKLQLFFTSRAASIQKAEKH